MADTIIYIVTDPYEGEIFAVFTEKSVADDYNADVCDGRATVEEWVANQRAGWKLATVYKVTVRMGSGEVCVQKESHEACDPNVPDTSGSSLFATGYATGISHVSLEDAERLAHEKRNEVLAAMSDSERTLILSNPEKSWSI